MFQFSGNLDQPLQTRGTVLHVEILRIAPLISLAYRGRSGDVPLNRAAGSSLKKKMTKRGGVGAVKLPTWTNNRLMTCKYGGANQAAVPTGHGKRRCDPLARNAHIGMRGGERVSDILDVFASSTCAHASRCSNARVHI